MKALLYNETWESAIQIEGTSSFLEGNQHFKMQQRQRTFVKALNWCHIIQLHTALTLTSSYTFSNAIFDVSFVRHRIEFDNENDFTKRS